MVKILLVDTSLLTREVLARRLERRGYQVARVSSGEGALDRARDATPDLILLDLSAGPAAALETARQLKASPRTQAVPIIGLTAHAPADENGGEVATIPGAGCDAFEVKSFDLAPLLRKITHLLEKARGQGKEGPRPPAVSGPAGSPTSSEGGPTVLVVDANPLSREMLARRLTREGFRVAVAASGPEAIDRLGRSAFDVVLLDMTMPEMSGLEVLAILRSSDDLGDVPVIAALPRDGMEDAEVVLGAGANACVTRPFHFPELLTHLRAHVVPGRSSPPAGPAREPASSLTRGIGGRVPPRVRPRSSAFTVEPFSATGSHSGDSLHQPRPPSCHDYLPEEVGTADWGDTWPIDNMRLAGYEILGELGRGGMGVVYKARHLCMNRVVALKVIDKEYLTRPRAIQRFYHEVQAAAQLAHRNIVMAFDAGELDETHYFAMEFVPGFDLGRWIEERGPLPIAVACHFITQSALGLQHAHERGLVHRDVKPSNLLITWDRLPPPEAGWDLNSALPPLEDAVVKILDLGLALLNDGGDGEGGGPAEGRAVGTADYMAPEQWANAHKVDVRADLYSLGATFYHLLTGQVPFPADEPMEKMLKHHLDEPAPVEQLRPDVPPEVAAVVRRLMAKQPGQRFQLAEEVVRALAEVRLP
jgi:CheY-like chemotaxis protein